MAISAEQYERWKDFAIRMARCCFTRRRNPTAKQIEANVLHFFDCLDSDDLLSIVDWDHCDPYPEGSRYYHKARRTSCWHCHGSKRPDCPYHCEDGQIYDYAEAQLVCDHISELGDSWLPSCSRYLSDAEQEKRDDQFCGPARCCIRAGLDLAVSPSAGVMGFTAGDIRKMYPEGVPDWVTGGADHRWTTQEFDGVVPGVGVIPGKASLNGTFAEMPDTAEVWI